jgi:hypothetical protein
MRPMPADSTPPTISFAAPAAGASVSGTAQVTAGASDNVGVTKVELAVDGTTVDTRTVAPWSFALDTGPLAGGSHTLRLSAFDAAGNSAGATISVTVTKDTTAPSKPGTPKALAIGTTELGLYWTPSTDATGVVAYELYRDGVKLAETTGTNFLASNLPALTTSKYWVVARDAAGNRSVVSSTLSVRTLGLLTSTTGTLAGVAYDSAGKPLANVVVSATVNGALKSSKTSSSGALKMTSIPPGEYTLTAALTGYQATTAQATAVAGETRLIVIALGR